MSHFHSEKGTPQKTRLWNTPREDDWTSLDSSFTWSPLTPLVTKSVSPVSRVSGCLSRPTSPSWTFRPYWSFPLSPPLKPHPFSRPRRISQTQTTFFFLYEIRPLVKLERCRILLTTDDVALTTTWEKTFPNHLSKQVHWKEPRTPKSSQHLDFPNPFSDKRKVLVQLSDPKNRPRRIFETLRRPFFPLPVSTTIERVREGRPTLTEVLKSGSSCFVCHTCQ